MSDSPAVTAPGAHVPDGVPVTSATAGVMGGPATAGVMGGPATAGGTLAYGTAASPDPSPHDPPGHAAAPGDWAAVASPAGQSSGQRPHSAAIARLAGTTTLALCPFLFVLALKPFAYGIWFQAEPITVGLLALGAVAGVCLLLLDLTGHRVWPVFREPPLLCLLVLILWSAVVSPLQDLPARSWFGTPETGEGIFAFLALLMLCALGWVLWPYPAIRRALALAATAAAVIIGALNAVLPTGSPWRPQLLGAYGGTIGPAVALVVLGAMPRLDRRAILVAFIAGLPAVLFSQSKVALLLYCVLAPLAWGGLMRVQWRWRPCRRRQCLALTPLAAVAAMALIAGAGMALPPLDVYAWLPRHAADAILHFTSAGATGIDLFYSLRSRSLLALAGFAGLAAHPLAWLTGFGWGSYNDLLYRHTFIAGVRGFQDGVWIPSWEGVGAGAFHVHSDPLETLFSAGLPAAIGYLAFLCAIVLRSRRAMLPFAAIGWFVIAGLRSAWYPSLLDYPFLAMAIAACCARWRPAPLRPALPQGAEMPLRGLGRQALCLAAAATLAFGARASAIDAANGGRLLAALNRQDPAELPVFQRLPPGHGRGGVHLWWAALNYVYFLDTRLSQGHKPTEAQALWYARLLDLVDRQTAAGRAGVRLAALTVAMRNDLAANGADTTLAALRQRALPGWDAAVVGLIRRAPDRTDVAVPDLAWLTRQRQYMSILGLCGQIFTVHPGDRVCLWYSGVALITDPGSRDAAFADLHRALAMDVGAVVPVTPAARQAVLAHFPPSAADAGKH